MHEVKPRSLAKVLGPERRVGSGEACWHVVHTKSRQEVAVAELIAGLGLEGFLPMARRVRYYGLRKHRVETPLFTGYLFLRSTIEDSYHLDRCGRVAQMIRVRDQIGLSRDLAQLRSALDREGDLTPGPVLVRGTWVEVRSGPFRGIRGQVDRSASEDRLSLAVQILGRAADLEIDRSLLEPIDAESSLARAG